MEQQRILGTDDLLNDIAVGASEESCVESVSATKRQRESDALDLMASVNVDSEYDGSEAKIALPLKRARARPAIIPRRISDRYPAWHKKHGRALEIAVTNRAQGMMNRCLLRDIKILGEKGS